MAKQRKSHVQSQNYHRILKNGNSEDTTGYVYSEMLQGSDEINNYSWFPETGKRESVAPPSVKERMKTWWNKHFMAVISSIVSIIIIPLLIFIVSNIYDLKKENAVISEKVETLKTNLSQIQGNYIDKQVLDLKLEVLEEKLKNDSPEDQAEIKQELSKIENQIAEIQRKK